MAIESNEVNVDIESCISNDFKSDLKFDLLVTEIFDCALLGEDAIRSILDAKKRLLTPNPHIIPKRGRLYCQAMYSYQTGRKSFKHFDENFSIGAYFTSRKKPERENRREPYEGERLSDLRNYEIESVTEKQLLMKCDFSSNEQMEKIIHFPEMETVIFNTNYTVNILVLTFELDLTDEIQIDNTIGTKGCWEQAVYPLTREICGDFCATFRLECDAPILVKVTNDEKHPVCEFFTSEKRIYLFNESERIAEIEKLFEKNKYILFYSNLQNC